MPDIPALVDSILALVVQAITTVFNVLFFWLPDDPFIDAVYIFQDNLVSNFGMALSWLNWFVDMSFLADMLFGLVPIFLVWAAYKLAIHVFGTTSKAIELIPFE